MNLNEKILGDLKTAMIARDAFAVSVLRMLIAAIKNKKIEAGREHELAEAEIAAVVQAEIKKRQDSITAYAAGNRQDLADKESAEIEILKKYQPEQMSEEEVKKIIAATLAGLGDIGPGDFGRVMGAIMPQVKGKADGNLVNKIVKELLAK